MGLYMKCAVCNTACRMSCYVSHCCTIICHNKRCAESRAAPRPGDSYRSSGSVILESHSGGSYYYVSAADLASSSGADAFFSRERHYKNGDLEVHVETGRKIRRIVLAPQKWGKARTERMRRREDWGHYREEPRGKKSARDGLGGNFDDGYMYDMRDRCAAPRPSGPWPRPTGPAPHPHGYGFGYNYQHQGHNTSSRTKGNSYEYEREENPESPIDPDKTTVHRGPGWEWTIREVE